MAGDIVAPTQTCIKCGIDYPATRQWFFADRQYKSGLERRCKKCRLGWAAWPAVPKEGFRFCTKCSEELPATHEYFWRHSASSHGFNPVCIKCQRGWSSWDEREPEGCKRCPECGEAKPATEQFFHPRKNGRLGLRRKCRECVDRTAPAPGLERKCTGCGVVKPATVEFFWRLPHGPAGLNPKCRECCNVRQRVEGKDTADILRLRSYRQKWRANNKEKTAGTWARSRAARAARLAASPQHFSPADVKRQFEGQKGRCWWCGKKMGKHYHVDHRVPLAKGGGNGADNIVIACKPCNLAKHDKMPWEFLGGRMF